MEIQRDVRQRLEQYQPGLRGRISFDAELQHIKTYIEKFIHDWCDESSDKSLKWHLSHDAISCWLLLALCIARKRFQDVSISQQQEHQQLLLRLSVRLFKEALGTPEAVRMTHRAAILPVAASIILRLSTRHDLILRLALRMAGEPEKAYVPTFVREAGNQMLVMLW